MVWSWSFKVQSCLALYYCVCFFSFTFLGVFLYIVYLCRPSEASTWYCVIPGGYPPEDWQSLPCAGEELDSNPGLLICSQMRYHWATSPPSIEPPLLLTIEPPLLLWLFREYWFYLSCGVYDRNRSFTPILRQSRWSLLVWCLLTRIATTGSKYLNTVQDQNCTFLFLNNEQRIKKAKESMKNNKTKKESNNEQNKWTTITNNKHNK